MNLLRKMFGRPPTDGVERRRMSGPLERSKAVSERLDRSIDRLHELTTCNRLRSKGECPVIVDNEVARSVQFETFADICEYRYSPENSLMRLCRHPEHEAHTAGIAPCQAGLCPKLKK